MQSHRRSRGKIFFEVLCALSVGASFVGAWIQTGAWAFIAPAFIFTLFGLYWSFDMFGSRQPVVAVAVEPRPAAAVDPVAVPAFEPLPAIRDAQPQSFASDEIHFERFEPPAQDEHQTAATAFLEPEPIAEPSPVIEPAPVAETKPKRRAKRAAVEAKVAAPPAVEPEPAGFDESAYHEAHIEQLFDPQPFARQARPAFGKRPRGPGPRPLPA